MINFTRKIMKGVSRIVKRNLACLTRFAPFVTITEECMNRRRDPMTYTKEEVRQKLREPNGAEGLLKEMSAAFEGAWQLWLEEDAGAAGLLARAARQKAWTEEITKRLQDRRSLHAALCSERYKMRKNAARLAGALKDPADVQPLIHALSREDMRMVRPSQILALGAMDCAEARIFLEAYQVLPPIDESEEVHCREEREALKKARASYQILQKHAFKGLDQERIVELICPEGLAGAMAQTLEKAGIPVQKLRQTGVRVRLQTFNSLQAIRGWQEVLFPMAAGEIYSPEAVALVCRNKVLPFLRATHEEERPFWYRLELRGVEDRRKAAAQISQAVDSSDMVNNPAAYEVELRIQYHGGRFRLDVKLYTVEDGRFAYRRKDLPASIHPATAAGIMELARPWLAEDAKVADPCCGSGTMLLERARMTPCQDLIGVDISRGAIEAAKENFRAARRPGRFLVKDCTRWKPPEPQDEIISNLPFGNRVGSHENNTALYRKLVSNLPNWLRPGGVAILYTMEIQLLQQLAEQQPELMIEKIHRTEAGGLRPAIFIIRKIENENLKQ